MKHELIRMVEQAGFVASKPGRTPRSRPSAEPKDFAVTIEAGVWCALFNEASSWAPGRGLFSKLETLVYLSSSCCEEGPFTSIYFSVRYGLFSSVETAVHEIYWYFCLGILKPTFDLQEYTFEIVYTCRKDTVQFPHFIKQHKHLQQYLKYPNVL